VDQVDRSIRASSFGSVAEDYDRYRPEPPDAAVAWLLRGRPRVALDVAAGTGAVTRVLVRHADEVWAVEPDPRMLAVLSRRLPQVRAMSGTAEALPVGDASVDALLVGSAWHWLDAERAVPEIARVLRPGGVLGLLWNSPDHHDPGFSQVWAGMRGSADASVPARSGFRGQDVRLPAGSPFADPELDDRPWTWTVPPRALAGLVGTYSRVLTLSPEERERVLADAGRVLGVDEPSGQTQDVQVPMRCRCWRAVRI
jgi:SAM-dependent methyltransferase